MCIRHFRILNTLSLCRCVSHNANNVEISELLHYNYSFDMGKECADVISISIALNHWYYHYREIVGRDPSTFYIFLSSGEVGRHAFFLNGIVWRDQEIIIYNPRYIGTYKDMPVIETSDPFIPMRTAVEIYDPPSSVSSFGLEIETCPFVHEGGKFSDKDIKTYRYVFVSCICFMSF